MQVYVFSASALWVIVVGLGALLVLMPLVWTNELRGGFLTLYGDRALYSESTLVSLKKILNFD